MVVSRLHDCEDVDASYWKQEVDSVVPMLRRAGTIRPMRIIGHSGAGTLLPGIAQFTRRPVAGYLSVDAELPLHGTSRLDEMTANAPEYAAQLRRHPFVWGWGRWRQPQRRPGIAQVANVARTSRMHHSVCSVCLSNRSGSMHNFRRNIMGRQAGSVRAHRVAAARIARAADIPPDYIDAFAVATASTETRTPEWWSRAVFEGAPCPVRWFLLLGWRGVLGLHLGPRPSADHVLGWRIVETEPDAVRLELRSTLMTAQLILRLASSMVVLTTNVYYARRFARPLWAAVGLIHRQMIPYLLGRAASRSAAGGGYGHTAHADPSVK